jgi:hypothetical protein
MSGQAQPIKHLRSPLGDQLKETNDNVTSISASLRKGKSFHVLKQLTIMP